MLSVVFWLKPIGMHATGPVWQKYSLPINLEGPQQSRRWARGSWSPRGFRHRPSEQPVTTFIIGQRAMSARAIAAPIAMQFIVRSLWAPSRTPQRQVLSIAWWDFSNTKILEIGTDEILERTTPCTKYGGVSFGSRKSRYISPKQSAQVVLPECPSFCWIQIWKWSCQWCNTNWHQPTLLGESENIIFWFQSTLSMLPRMFYVRIFW